jgi:hypothetical protein
MNSAHASYVLLERPSKRNEKTVGVTHQSLPSKLTSTRNSVGADGVVAARRPEHGPLLSEVREALAEGAGHP